MAATMQRLVMPLFLATHLFFLLTQSSSNAMPLDRHGGDESVSLKKTLDSAACDKFCKGTVTCRISRQGRNRIVIVAAFGMQTARVLYWWNTGCSLVAKNECLKSR